MKGCGSLVYMKIIPVGWLDEKPERMAKIPPKEEMVGKVPINCRNQILLIMLVSLIIGDYRITPLMNFPTKCLYYGIIIALAAWDAYRQKKEMGYIEIYPEMFVTYWYDKQQKRVRPQYLDYWKDVVQYSGKENAIWFHSPDTYPYCPSFDMKKMLPYLEKYAPHAKVVDFDVDKYWKKKAEKARLKLLEV